MDAVAFISKKLGLKAGLREILEILPRLGSTLKARAWLGLQKIGLLPPQGERERGEGREREEGERDRERERESKEKGKA